MKAKLVNGDEQDYFSRRSRRLLRFGRGEGRRIKRGFWKRQRAQARFTEALINEGKEIKCCVMKN